MLIPSRHRVFRRGPSLSSSRSRRAGVLTLSLASSEISCRSDWDNLSSSKTEPARALWSVTAAAAEAAPDGYTLLAGLNANMAVNPSLFAKLSYDPIRDFSPVAMLAEYPFAVVVSQNLPVNSIKELSALARSRPGEINYASAGNGSGQQLSAELFKLMTGVNLTHVLHRGAAPAYADVISGQVPVFFDSLSSALGQIRSGNVRALAVTSRERSPLLPDVPTLAEAGVPRYEYYVWFGLWPPKNTPQPIIEKLHATVREALADSAMK